MNLLAPTGHARACRQLNVKCSIGANLPAEQHKRYFVVAEGHDYRRPVGLQYQ